MSLSESPRTTRRELLRDSKGRVLSSYSDEIATEILDKLRQGEHMSQILASEHMPSMSAFQCWMEARPSLKADYARAREGQAQFWAHQIVELSDTCGLSSDQINRTRLQVDARKWVASKLLPRIYGDKVQTEIGRPGEFEAIDSARLLADQIAARLGSPKLIEAQAIKEESD